MKLIPGKRVLSEKTQLVHKLKPSLHFQGKNESLNGILDINQKEEEERTIQFRRGR